MKFFSSIVLIVFALFIQPVYAEGENLSVVLHINDGFKLGHLGKSVKNIRTELGADVNINVVVNGKAVMRLLKSNVESSKIIKSIIKQNVPIGLCHNAINNNNVKPEMLIEGLEVLPTDGNVTVIKYQQQGYIYIKL